MPRIALGTTWSPLLGPMVEQNGDLLDFLEISPDVLCRERRCPLRGTTGLVLDPELLDRACRAATDTEVVVHGLGLSIGSAAGWNEGYLDMLDAFAAKRRFAWHSEHLGYLLYRDHDGRVCNAGVPLPIPCDVEALQLIAARAAAVVRRYGVPFLLENVAWYLSGIDRLGGIAEPEFLNRLCHRSGAGLLLDLFNLHCNAVNHGFAARDWLDALELEHVVEVHMAGGPDFEGFAVDVHSQVSTAGLKDLLECVLARAPRVRGVVFELLEESAGLMGVDGHRNELRELRAMLRGGGCRVAG
ncbi:MAG: DUF692 family protein [Planctomycetes bacterium]|nr:DUF692 family protein [Planctomycetota bacterium]MCB9868296.1 DUF692 family protein [Planctomycetota bacterium]